MNKEYIRIGDNAIVEDSLGNKRIVPYSEKLDEILVQENLVEHIEKKISFFESNICEDMDKKANVAKRCTIICFFTFFIMPGILPKIVPNIIGIPDIYWIKLGFSQSTFMSVAFSIACAPLGIYLFRMLYKEYRDYNKKKWGIKNVIEKLSKDLEKEKDKLNELKSKSKGVEDKQTQVTKIKTNFTELDKRILLYRDYVKNSKYNNEEQNIVKEYYEEKGRVYTKKFKPRSK